MGWEGHFCAIIITQLRTESSVRSWAKTKQTHIFGLQFSDWNTDFLIFRVFLCEFVQNMGATHLSTDLKERIISYWQRFTEDHGFSPSYGSMADIFDVPKPTIFRLVKKFKSSGSVENVPKGHRKRLTTERQDRQIVIEAKKNPFVSAGYVFRTCVNTGKILFLYLILTDSFETKNFFKTINIVLLEFYDQNLLTHQQRYHLPFHLFINGTLWDLIADK